MKRRTLKPFALLLSFLLTALIATPAFSLASPTHGLNEYDQEMLLAFWQQPAYDGLTNGEAVYDIHLGEDGYLLEPAPVYDGSYWTHLLYDSDNSGTITFEFHLSYWLDGWDGCFISPPGQSDMPRVTVNPDLHGTMDLHGTNISSLITSETQSLTHITDVVLDDCPYLWQIIFRDQPAVNTLSAKNSPIYWISTTGSTFKSIEFDSSRYSEPMHLMSEGDGCVSVYHNIQSLGNISQLTAESKGEMFMGWYKEGELISADPYVEVTEGGEYVARFGGDVDGDGSVSAADALLLMRMCMGLIPMEGMNADMNMNGEQDATDALLILRFVMGLI